MAALRKPTAWVVAALVAGLATTFTALGTDLGKAGRRAADTAICNWRNSAPTKGEQPLFTVVVARVHGDSDNKAQARVSERLLPGDFVVLKGCEEGPSVLGADRRDFDSVAREAATRELTRRNADVLIWGSVDKDVARLRLADRNGYCSNQTVDVPLNTGDDSAARAALTNALADHVIKALISDCNGSKLEALPLADLQRFDRKIDYIVDRFATRTAQDTKANLWLYRAWVKARISSLDAGETGLQGDLSNIIGGARDNYAAAATFWGLKTFGEKRDMPQVEKRALDEAYHAYRTWPQDTPAWVSAATLAANRIDADNGRDPQKLALFYDNLMAKAGGKGEDFVPIANDEVFRIWYRYGAAVNKWPGAPDVDVEHAVKTFARLIKLDLDGDQVPVTTNSLRFGLATALYNSARRFGVDSRLAEARELIDYIAAHPDDSNELTPAVLGDLRAKLASACAKDC